MKFLTIWVLAILGVTFSWINDGESSQILY